MQSVLVFFCVVIIAVSNSHVHNSSHHYAHNYTYNITNPGKKCDFEPTKGHHLCDRFYPSSCYPPVCATGTNGETKWFKNECYLEQTNRECPTKFSRVDDNKCDAKTKPSVDPKPCPTFDEITASVAGTIVHEVRQHCTCH